jgi:hypothetical protein
MNKQDIQNQIKNAVLDTDIQDIYIVGIQIPQFANEPTNVMVGIKQQDLDEWIEECGLLQQEVDGFDPFSDLGHTSYVVNLSIEDILIDEDLIREYIRTNDKFSIL